VRSKKLVLKWSATVIVLVWRSFISCPIFCETENVRRRRGSEKTSICISEIDGRVRGII
jgi:hypothetical protein